MSKAKKKILQGIIDELLNNEIIRESNSPYAAQHCWSRRKRGITECALTTGAWMP
jgi:hypothetical protein